MTEAVIRDSLISHFHTLNEMSGADFLVEKYTEGSSEYYKNVHYPNKRFSVPDNKRFFELTFLPSEPSPVAIGEDSQNEWNGILQIDICTPLDVGEFEADDKKSFLYELFKRGTSIDDVEITKVYSPTAGAESDFYRTVVRVNWTAIIDN